MYNNELQIKAVCRSIKDRGIYNRFVLRLWVRGNAKNGGNSWKITKKI